MNKVFADDFIQEQINIFRTQSQKAGEMAGLLNYEVTNGVINYLRELTTDEANNQEGEARTYQGLLELIYAAKRRFLSYRQDNNHPYVEALDKVKANIMKSIEASHPNLHAKYQSTLADIENSIWKSNKQTFKDAVLVVACGFWCIPQKLLSCANCGEDGCACCEREKSGSYLKDGAVNGWYPIASIASASDDFDKHCKVIGHLEPTALAMRK